MVHVVDAVGGGRDSYEWCMLLMLLVVVGIAMSGACC